MPGLIIYHAYGSVFCSWIRFSSTVSLPRVPGAAKSPPIDLWDRRTGGLEGGRRIWQYRIPRNSVDSTLTMPFQDTK